MIETLIVLLGFFCPAPDLPTRGQVSSVLQTGWPSATVYGSPHDWPTAPRDDGDLTYKIAVDPLYDDYSVCFTAEVRTALNDTRSWEGVREADIGETPNVWIVLTPPGGTCATPAGPQRTCAAGAYGRGYIGVNSLRWFNGSSQSSGTPDRIHLINHEVGHMLGWGHLECETDGSHVMVPAEETGDCEYVLWPNP